MTDDDFNPTLPTSAGPIAELEKRLLGLLQSIRLVRGKGYNLRPGNLGTALEILPGDPAAKVWPRLLFVRTIGIDCMWVSHPQQNEPQLNYWFQGDHDTQNHFFCLKPWQLQNASWFDEVTGAMRDNPAYGLSVGNPDPSVDGELYNVGTGIFRGLTQRTLTVVAGPPAKTETQYIVPQLWTHGWGVGETNYAGTAPVWGLAIPPGLFVCDERGKLVWDYLSGAPYPADVHNTVETWAIDDPDGPGGFVSVPKAGKYAVTFIDLNVDGRHWDRRQLTDQQESAALGILNVTGLADGAYTISVASGVPFLSPL